MTTHQKALLPCPFCGKGAKVAPDEIGSGGQHVPPYHAGCFRGGGCGVVFTADDPDEAIAEWNRRTYIATLAPADNGLVERLRGENPDKCTVTDRLRAHIGMPDTFELDVDDLIELDELILEASDTITARNAEIERLKAMLDKAVEALEPFARAGVRVIEERPDAPDAVPFDVMVDEHDNGIIMLTWGHLRAARSTLAAIQEARHAGE